MTKRKEKIYVVHYCKNKKCNNAWIDVDLTNAKSRPPRWKYCDSCCEIYGFVNPITPPKKKLSEKQWETINKNKFPKRKKLTVAEEKDIKSIKGGVA